MLALADIKGGDKILDVGCGRGELVLHGGLHGALAFGVESSQAAIEICRKTRRIWENKNPGISQNAHFIKTRGAKFPFKEDSFDTIWLSDIVEHLDPNTLSTMLDEIFRVSKKTGRILIHTSPNKYYISIGGRLMALLFRILKILRLPSYRNQQNIPWNIRKTLPEGLQLNIHINEQSRHSLIRYLKKSGFSIKNIWFELNPHYIDFLFPDSKGFRIIGILKKIFPIKHIFHADLYCIATPASGNFSTQHREQMGNPQKS